MSLHGFRFWGRLRLGNQLGILLATGAVILGIIFYLYTSRLQRKLFLEGFEAHTTALFETVQLGLEVGLADENFGAIHTVFNWVKKKDSLSWIVLTDATGQIFAQYPEASFATIEDLQKHAATASIESRDIVRSGKWSAGTLKGELFLGFSTQALREHERRIIRDTGLSISILLAGILSLVFLFSKGLTGPLERLRLATQRITAGDLRARADENQSGSIEVQSVAHSVNVMVGKLVAEQEKSDSLLLNILPPAIAKRLKDGESQIVDAYESVTVLFADIVGFTVLASQVSPERLVEILNRVFTSFDLLAEQLKVEKVKTIGDCYMAVCGLPERIEHHAETMVKMAQQMQHALNEVNRIEGTALQIRTGIHSGRVVAGVIGKKKFAYDLWGDTVNTASRMEFHGGAGRIHLSAATAELLAGKFKLEDRGEVEIKGKGPMSCYFLSS